MNTKDRRYTVVMLATMVIALCPTSPASGGSLALAVPSANATANATVSWTTGLPQPMVISDPAAMSCPTETTCVIAGHNATARSVDGGRNWLPMTLDGNTGLTDVSCAAQTQCIGIATDGSAQTTTDGGLHWARHRLADSTGHRVSCPSTTTCFTAGTVFFDSSPATMLLRSTDLGATWSERPLPSGAGAVSALTCPSESSCRVLVGTTLYRTDDSGLTWASDPLPQTPVDDIDCPTVSKCVYIHRSTRVARTSSDGGAHWDSFSMLSADPVAIDCTPVTCVIGGVMIGGQGTAQVLDANGVPGLAETLPEINGPTALACATSHCVVTGRDLSDSASLRDRTLISDDAGSSWRATTVTVQRTFADIACPSTSFCIAVGTDQALGGSTAGAAFVTSDGGANWMPESLPSDVGSATSIACATSDRCVVVGTRANGAPAVVRTGDGGATWASASSSPNGVRADSPSCPSIDRCYLTTETYDGGSPGNGSGNGSLHSSSDGGNTWTLVRSWPGEAIFGLECVTAQRCLVLRGTRLGYADRAIESTTDGGASWTVANPGIGVSDVWCGRHDDACFASSFRFSVLGSVHVTHDFGKSWMTRIAVAGGDGGDCPSAGVCMALGPSAAGLTLDAGATWSAVPLPSGQTMSALTCPSATTCWAVSTSGSTTALVRAAITLASPPIDPAPTSAAYTPSQPARLLESRPGLATVDGASNGIGRRTAGSVTELHVTERAGTPNTATAVALNVTAVDTAAPGYLTVYPCGTDRPNASNVNYATNATVANTAITKIGTGGNVCIFTNAPTDLIVDINGYFAGGTAYTPSQPARLLESRPGLATVDGASNGIGRRTAGSVTELHVTERAGTPNTATAVALNVTAVDTAAPGYLTVYPCGTDRPNASNVNYATNATVANTAITKIGTGGNVCIFTNAPTDLIVDINGYFAGGTAYTPSQPARLLESRPGLATVDGTSNDIGRRTAGSVTELHVTERAGTPNTATAVALNVTAVDTAAPGYLTVYPCGTDRPNASNVNYATNATVANTAITKIGTGGNVCIFTNAPTDLIVDINGYFAG